MNDRERLEAIVKVVLQYLPPDGIYGKEAMGKIIELVDPLPPKKQWVGLSVNEARKFYEKYTDREELIYAIDEFLEEKNNG